MKSLNLILIITFLLPVFALATTPSVILRYSDIFDSWCSNQTGIEITKTDADRLITIFPDLQAAWDKAGPPLLVKTESIVKKSFYQNELIGTVFLCKKTPSMSMPLLINANWFVKDNPQPADLVVDIIYHELIHTYLVDNFPNLFSSPLITKYQNEGDGVLAHLHLMAIQKKVYLALGLKDRIDGVIKFDSEYYKGAYKRAWEIVNLEGEDNFVLELR